jgi:hypothetical protein
MQRPLYLLRCRPQFSIFIKSLVSFNSSLLQMFGHLLGPRSFNSPKGPLAYKQASLPIVFGDISFILTTIISPTTYLGCWALVVSIIVTRFMVNQHPFLFEALAQIDNNNFPFQQHLKATCNLILFLTCAYFPLFKQLIEQQMVQLQDSIFEHLHHHTFSSMFCD